MEVGNPAHVGASMPGTVVAVHCKVGERVAVGAPSITLEAMKMETVVRAQRAGEVKEVVVAAKGGVQVGFRRGDGGVVATTPAHNAGT